ncbi:hypothetical protein HY635_02145, partial [Candidatus Uhrbacteria bacterium]|nr:hypothetical protein [Candidatus Uhrbacteria bacterium]
SEAPNEDTRELPRKAGDDERTDGTDVEATDELGDVEQKLRRGRVRGKTEVWSEAAGSAAAVDPQTGLRYEFKGEYLRPPAW